MNEALLVSVRKRIWKFRFMLYWRSAAIVLLCAFMVLWVVSPMFLAAYLGELPFTPYTPLKYVRWLCVPMLVLNLLLSDSEDNIVCLGIKTLNGTWGLLSVSIKQGKWVILILKEMRTSKLSAYEMDRLRACLDDIGVSYESLK